MFGWAQCGPYILACAVRALCLGGCVEGTWLRPPVRVLEAYALRVLDLVVRG